ncbi:MAG: hypothetical protein KGL39_26165 [Patescibacteria group bacterium]|nr:hypothetical protein [Patescibacteria group bacterium]
MKKSYLAPVLVFAYVAFFALAVAFAQQHSVAIQILDPNNTNAGYAVYRLSGSCPAAAPTTTPPSGFTLLNATAVPQTGTTTNYSDNTVTAGAQYCYTVVAIVGGAQAAPSNAVGVQSHRFRRSLLPLPPSKERKSKP